MAQAMAIMHESSATRTSRAHRLNDASSRSHSVFTVTLRHHSGATSRLSLVDLAGSERVKSTEAEVCGVQTLIVIKRLKT